MRRTRIAVGTGLAVLAVALGAVLAASPVSVAGLNKAARTGAVILKTHKRVRACQDGEVLPRGTSSVRLHAFADAGPKVKLWIQEHGNSIASGEVGAGWSAGTVTVPVKPLSSTRSNVTLCFDFRLQTRERLEFAGEFATPGHAAQSGGKALPGRIGAEYLRPAHSSFWSSVPATARRMGLGHAGAGTWSAVLVALVMLGVTGLVSVVLLREFG